MRVWRAVRGVVVGLAAVVGPAVPVAAAAVIQQYDIWSWNVAGSKVHKGSTTDGMVEAAANSINGRDIDFAAFNELCRGQYNALITRLRALGWPQDDTNFARFSPSRPAAAGICRSGEDFGNAIFSERPLGGAQRFTLPDDGNVEQRNLTCVAPLESPRVRFCTTHITTSNEIAGNGLAHNVNQLNAVRDRLDTYAGAGDSVLIAGDFNAQPHYGRLNNWYSPSLNIAGVNDANTGHYRELDDNDAGNCRGYGEWTSTGTPGAVPPCGGSAKIDLIFVREDAIAAGTGYSGDSLSISTACTGIAATADYPAGSCSDHRILIGTVTVTAG